MSDLALPAPRQTTPSRGSWLMLLSGQFLLIFAIVALAGPGRIDIVDGQTRFAVAQSLVEHGDSAIRDSRVWFHVFPGRDGQHFTTYRAPQSLIGATAIVVADATGPVEEGRRHFFFTLQSAVACGLLTVAYGLWFRRLGMSPGRTFLWSSLGIFATPSWYYGTSTFDDILGTAVVVWAIVLAYLARERWFWVGAAAVGLLLGLAFNCKEPLAIFVLPVLAALRNPGRSAWAQLGLLSLILPGLACGIATYKAYDLVKFPPEALPAMQADFKSKYVPVWTSNPLPGLLGLTVSPGAGALWYCPPLLLGLWGLARWRSKERWLVRATCVASAIFIVFLSFLTYFAGDPTWGPRYLTPVFAVLWLFTPAGAEGRNPLLVRGLIGLGVLVQLLALSVDPHRLYIARNLESAFYYHRSPWLYFDRDVSHLLNRPREIGEILEGTYGPSLAFTPSPSPTFAFPVIDYVDNAFPAAATSAAGLGAGLGGPLAAPSALLTRQSREDRPAAIRKYHVLNSLRPWWVNQQYLAPDERPMALLPTALLLLGMAGAGSLLLWTGAKLHRGKS